MDYLKNIGFTSEEIENLVENVPTKVLDLLKVSNTEFEFYKRFRRF